MGGKWLICIGIGMNLRPGIGMNIRPGIGMNFVYRYQYESSAGYWYQGIGGTLGQVFHGQMS